MRRDRTEGSLRRSLPDRKLSTLNLNSSHRHRTAAEQFSVRRMNPYAYERALDCFLCRCHGGLFDGRRGQCPVSQIKGPRAQTIERAESACSAAKPMFWAVNRQTGSYDFDSIDSKRIQVVIPSEARLGCLSFYDVC
jgi:hypothetical protein